MNLFIESLNISNFRCYDALRINMVDSESLAKKIIIITGENGAGKTNILEAISMLTPGRGLRNSDIKEMKNKFGAENETWTISAQIKAPSGLITRVGTALDRDKKKRVVRINGKTAKNQTALSEIISVIWLTPQMDRLFIEGATARRKFIDRLVFAYEPSHITRVNHYEKKMRERLKLLQSSDSPDNKWLSTLEKEMAEDSVSIAAARINLINHLQEHAFELISHTVLFPTPILKMNGWAEQRIEDIPAAQIEEELKEIFKNSRGIDKESKRTHEGAHKSDLMVTYKEKDIMAAQCSTGEQKTLLFSIILAHALMMQQEKGSTPIILLDEVAAHLDVARREELFKVLKNLNGQIFLTGTDRSIFSSLKNIARFITITDGQIV